MSKVQELQEILTAERKVELAEASEAALTFGLGDAIRSGCKVTEKADEWGANGKACALSAGWIGARARQGH
jgi:hypothetical protein